MSADSRRVLLIDDDPVTRELVSGMLERVGLRVREAGDGRAGLREMYARAPDLVILDVEMPELDGWQTLERIREVSDVPVLMLTAREAELERVRGLRGGADDYVVKPFGHQELLARVQALLRRSELGRGGGERGDGEDGGSEGAAGLGGSGPGAAGRGAGRVQNTYADERVEIDVAQRAVRYEQREVRLTPLEFKLLLAFVRHPNQVLSREQLLELVWGDAFGVSPGQVKLYVGYLRRKLDPLAPHDTPIETVRGFGYRYRRGR
jgi:DNA-binding response OmpR family regulator